MSLISSKCNELLTMAAYLVVHDLPEVAAMVRDAADTILELRDDLQQANADNSKLRELVDELYPLADYGAMDASELDRAHDLMRELGMHDLMRELGIEVD